MNKKEKKTQKKIDIGVVTFFASNNFGAVLQAYALQKKIMELGYSTEILNYHQEEKNSAEQTGKRKALSAYKSYFRILKRARFNIKTLMKARRQHMLSVHKFDAFRRDCMKISQERLYDMEDLARIEPKYRAFVAGSDMVWTEKGQNLEVFFLRFTKEDKRFSYAASLTGTGCLTQEKKETIGEYIREVKSVSCREEEGIEFAREFGKEAFLALDPTLLLTREEWTRELSLKKAEEKYILCYCFGETPPHFFSRVNKIAKKRNLKVRHLAISLDKYIVELNNGNSDVYGPREFVEMFFNAEFVITNTFHGLIFSLIGEKPFALLQREASCKWKKNEERMLNMLRLTGTEKRSIVSVDEIDEDFFEIDYKKINEVFSEKRKLSLEYLTDMLKNVENYVPEAEELSSAKTVSEISDKLCTGCTACVSACPVHCIEMKPDKEGFLKPVVDSEKCTSCGVCSEVCPAINDFARVSFAQKGYVAFSRDDIAKNSASGGIFITLAKYVVEKLGGTVYGCALEENTLKCVHKRAETIAELYSMQNSKYVQSDVRGCFAQVKRDLIGGRFVLFSGTPCQIAGLKSFLGKSYDNLLAVDIVCHGVPSPVLFEKELENWNKVLGEPVKAYTFRNKDNEEKVRSAFELTVMSTKKKIKKKSRENAYFKTFLNGYTYRMSCYYCKYADRHRCGDITLGDCDSWRKYPDFYPQKAKSAVLINSEAGDAFWYKAKDLFVFDDLDIEEEIRVNKQLSSPTVMPLTRKRIYQDINEKGWSDFEKRYSKKENKLRSFIGRTAAKLLRLG